MRHRGIKYIVNKSKVQVNKNKINLFISTKISQILKNPGNWKSPLAQPVTFVTSSSYTLKMASTSSGSSSYKLRKDFNVYLVGYISRQIVGAKLPSNQQALSVFFSTM